MAGLTSEQRRVLATIVRVADRRGIGPKLRLAAVETGLVESGLRNLRYGDGSSVGWRQETKSSYPGVNRRNVAASVNRFFNEALPLRHRYASAGALAQAVQRSAFPDRYQGVRGQAKRLLAGSAGGSAGGGRAIASSSTTRTAGPQGSALALLQALSEQQGPQQAPSVGLAPPSFSARPALPQTYQAPQSGGGPAPKPDLSALLAAVQTSGDTGSSSTTTDVVGGAAGQPAAPAAGGGRVIVAPGANRAGIGLQKPIRTFLHELAGASGRTVHVGTGTNHNQFVAGTNRQSDHWDGNASDLPQPVDSKQGDLVAAHAIALAGGIRFPKALAMARQGGVWSFQTKLGRVQILWKTNVGGNHHNHVHIGVNPGR